jgi:hypothetical protein
MRRTTMLWEVFVTRFQEAFEQYEKHRLSGEEAGELLGMSGRNFRRLCVRYEEDGVEGLRDRRIGKVSPRRAPERELERMHALYRERYADFTVKHFHEQLVKRHDYKLCYTVTKLSLQAAGLAAKAKRRGAHRKKRVRRPLPGMLLFQDGSTHRWIAALGHDLDLIVTLDDATGEIYSAFLVEQEGTMSSLLGLAETIGRHGLFGAFYTDRGGHYFLTPKDARKVDKTQLTQVGRALSHLGITHIPSYSPQARGRMERVFGTLQKRLPQELRLARIRTVAAATGSSRNASCPTTTPASRCRRPSRARPSCPMSAGRSRTCCASRRIAWSAPTIASPGTAAVCRFRRSANATTMSAPPCACINTRTAGSPSSTARAASPALIRKDAPTMSSLKSLESAQRPRSLWICGQRKRVAHKPPQAQQQQKKRTFDVLQNADIFTRYGHPRACILGPVSFAPTYPRRESWRARAPAKSPII